MNDRRGKLTDQIFDDPTWFTNRHAFWRFGPDQRACESFEEADERRVQLTEWLWKQGSNNPELLLLGDRLSDCRPTTPCRSPACPSCRRAYCRWAVTSAAMVLRATDDEIKVLGITDGRHAVPVGALTPEVFHTTGSDIANTLKECGVRHSIVMVDNSANESVNGEFDPHWQPHGWAFALAAQIGPAERAIRDAFPATDTVPRPVNIRSWDGDLAALAYGFTEPVRRVSSIRPAASDGSRRACRDTRVRDLRVEQKREFLTVVDQAGFAALLHLRGFRLTKTADGPQIRRIVEASK